MIVAVTSTGSIRSSISVPTSPGRRSDGGVKSIRVSVPRLNSDAGTTRRGSTWSRPRSRYSTNSAIAPSSSTASAVISWAASVEKARLKVCRYSMIELSAIWPFGKPTAILTVLPGGSAVCWNVGPEVSPICASVHGMLLSTGPAKQATCETSGTLKTTFAVWIGRLIPVSGANRTSVPSRVFATAPFTVYVTASSVVAPLTSGTAIDVTSPSTFTSAVLSWPPALTCTSPTCWTWSMSSGRWSRVTMNRVKVPVTLLSFQVSATRSRPSRSTRT